jgi:hypothetical protein
MVGHQAIGPDADLVLAAPLAEQIEVGAVVIVAEERLLPPVASLRDVVRAVGDNDSC